MAIGQLQPIRARMGDDLYARTAKSMKSFFCSYYATTRGLTKTKSIFPIESGVPGSKAFKARWLIPGNGKSSGLRLILLANCATMTVRIVGAWVRRDDPSDGEIATSLDKGKS